MRSTPVFLVLGLTLGSCSPELGVPDGYCENDCTMNWTPNCERDCDIPNPNADGGAGREPVPGAARARTQVVVEERQRTQAMVAEATPAATASRAPRRSTSRA